VCMFFNFSKGEKMEKRGEEGRNIKKRGRK
jgi:hypothetical protein